MAGLDLKVQMAAQFRDAAGRFARANPHDALAKMVKKWSARALTELREASPVDPGALRAGWRADFAPSQTEVRIGPRLRDEATSRRAYLATFTSPEQALAWAVLESMVHDVKAGSRRSIAASLESSTLAFWLSLLDLPEASRDRVILWFQQRCGPPSWRPRRPRQAG